MGHCIESGYGLVGDDGDVRILDAKATPLVVEKVEGSRRGKGIKLRAVREENEKEMETTRIEEI